LLRIDRFVAPLRQSGFVASLLHLHLGRPLASFLLLPHLLGPLQPRLDSVASDGFQHLLCDRLVWPPTPERNTPTILTRIRLYIAAAVASLHMEASVFHAQHPIAPPTSKHNCEQGPLSPRRLWLHVRFHVRVGRNHRLILLVLL